MDINYIQNLKNQAISSILSCQNQDELENLRVAFLGRSGQLSELTKSISSLPKEDRSEFGQLINETKKIIEDALLSQKEILTGNKIEKTQKYDITLPGIKPPLGHQHPITQAIEEISSIFENIGYKRVRYPEITTDWYCFEGVNVPSDHPSRDDQETFFLENGMVLSTHTTSGILREAEISKPPIRMLNIAKCYRRQIDVSHTPMFHQFEGWLIDKNVNIGHLKWTLDYFAKNFFGDNRKTRIRPHHFQYTEPSFEVDITCGACNGKGCRSCKDGWMELGGSGMAHPQVLKNAGIDPKIYSGLAFGWGVERVFSMRSKVDDGRLYYQNDSRFLEQF
jgi:phenylalanyl-tRNA synthetase alpha chain